MNGFEQKYKHLLPSSRKVCVRMCFCREADLVEIAAEIRGTIIFHKAFNFDNTN